jgi:hypothetical protein
MKLNLAGILDRVLDSFTCVVPAAVYDEVIVRGKARAYMDAEVIEAQLAGKVEVLRGHSEPKSEADLGAGESGVLGVLAEMPDALVVSDDRRFLARLSRDGLAFQTPAQLTVVLAQTEILTHAESDSALVRLRPAIGERAYEEARQRLEALRSGQ